MTNLCASPLLDGTTSFVGQQLALVPPPTREDEIEIGKRRLHPSLRPGLRGRGLVVGGRAHDTATKGYARSMGNRLYAGNPPLYTRTDALRDAFARFGQVTDVHLVAARQTGQPRGFGFVFGEDGKRGRR